MKKPMSDTAWSRRAVAELIARCVRMGVAEWRQRAEALARRVK